MHWRQAFVSNGTAFYIVVVALSASVAVTTALLLLRHYA
jgi:hypothetical protein